MSNPYSLLGVSSSATEKEVHEAYRKKVKEVHPDLGGSTEDFKKVRGAYESIIDDNVSEFTIDSKDKNHYQPKSPSIRWSTIHYLNYDVIMENNWNIDSAFKKAKNSSLSNRDFGSFTMSTDNLILDAAEENGLEWPYSCRGGACANCSIKLIEGRATTAGYYILSDKHLDDGLRLSCVAKPLTKNLKIIYNVKNMEKVRDMLLPTRRD